MPTTSLHPPTQITSLPPSCNPVKTASVNSFMPTNRYFTSVSEAAPVIPTKSNELKVLQLNVRGINYRKKFNQLRVLIDSFKCTFDVIVFSEVKLNDKFPLQIYSLPGFNRFSCLRSVQKGGGVIAFVRSTIPAEEVKVPPAPFEKIHLILSFSNVRFRMLAYYRAPDPNNLSEFFDDLENDLMDSNTKTFIVGDINISSRNLSVRTTPLNLASRQYQALLDSYGYSISNNLPTRPVSGKTIDHFVSNFPDNYPVENSTVELDKKISDHNIIISSVHCDFKISRHCGKVTRSRLDFKTLVANFPDIRDSVISCKDANKIADSITIALQDAIKNSSTNHSFPVKHLERICDWTSAETLELMEEKDKWLRKRRGKPSSDVYRKRLRDVSFDLDASIEKDFSQHINKKIATSDPKKMWRGLNDVLGRAKSHCRLTVISADGNQTSEPVEVSEILCDSFSKGVQQLIPSEAIPPDDQIVEHEPASSMSLIPPTIDEVLTSIRCLRSGSAPGLDGIGPKVVKHLGQQLAPLLAHLIEVIFDSGEYPLAFKLAVVTPIFKNGSRLSVDNYRPISVLPVLNKIVERAIHTRLTEYFVSRHRLIYSHQFGFRAKSGTENAAIELNNMLLKAFDEKKCATAVFMDLRKAFDIVNHRSLLNVLFKYGVRGKALDVFTSYLKDRRQVVKVEQSLSSESSITSGVVQGSCLGPLLFLIFLNAIGNLQTNGKLFLFADDAVLVNVHKTRNSNEISETIRNDMTPIIAFFKQRRMVLNESKTNFMLLTSPTMQLNFPSSIEINPGMKITRVATAKYLGLVIHEHLNWTAHIENLEKKLAPASGILWKLRDVLPLKSRKLVYDTLFQTHLNYMTPIWGFSPCCNLTAAQILQNRALRNVYGLPYRSSRVDMYLHRVESHLPIRGICLLNTATYMYRSLHGATLSNLNFKKVSDIHSYQLRNASSLRPAAKSNNYGARAIATVGPEIFNKVPESIKNLRNPRAFRWALRCHLRKDKFISTCFDNSFFKYSL
jgi:Reverse transcriptase (RNA-dependent DNA polymerase)